MPATLDEWKVLPHDRLTPIGETILTVTGEIAMPLTTLQRRMTVVRLDDGKLVVFSAIALDPQEMRAIEDFGTPAFLVVPNDHHRMDAKIWKDRYPALRVVAPPGARAAVAEELPVDDSAGDFGDASVRFVIVPGTDQRESALEIDGPDGLTLVINDVIGNIHDAGGFGGWMLRRMGFAGDAPQLPLPVRINMVEDKAALRAQFLRWAGDERLRRILVSHGEPIVNNPQGALRALAAALE